MSSRSQTALAPGVERLFDRFYAPGQGSHWLRDSAAPLYDWMLSSLEPGARVLDVGAGAARAEPRQRVRHAVGRLSGVDIDAGVLTNPDLDEARVIDGVHLPYEEATFDAVYSDWTMEHVEHPELLLREIRRVLKRGGSYWLRTTNLRHYVTLISAATPYRFHTWLLRATGSGPEGREPWPTHYRANTPARMRRLLEGAGYERCELVMVEPFPTYLTFSRIAFLLGVLYERTVNCTHRLSGFRLILIVRATKDAAGEPSGTDG